MISHDKDDMDSIDCENDNVIIENHNSSQQYTRDEDNHQGQSIIISKQSEDKHDIQNRRTKFVLKIQDDFIKINSRVDTFEN